VAPRTWRSKEGRKDVDVGGGEGGERRRRRSWMEGLKLEVNFKFEVNIKHLNASEALIVFSKKNLYRGTLTRINN
jgi:hypothetical protein